VAAQLHETSGLGRTGFSYPIRFAKEQEPRSEMSRTHPTLDGGRYSQRQAAPGPSTSEGV